MKLKKTELALIFALIVSIVFHVVPFYKNSQKIAGEVLRLHILAHSDGTWDQALKLKVRDMMLTEGAFIFRGVSSLEEAEKSVTGHLGWIGARVRRLLRENGCSYPVKVSLVKDFFQTRYYDNFTLPAGNYEALKIEIGAAQGHNWWCVMYPQMCLEAASETEKTALMTEEEKRLIFSDTHFEVRFKIVEICENIKNKLKID